MNAAPASGAAFPLPVKLLATALVAGMAVGGARAWPELSQAQWSPSAAVVLGLAVAMVAWCLYWIWRSRTSIDARGISQTWMWDKHVAWADVTQARLIGVPRLEWLIAPRLAVRVKGGRGLVVFHAADTRVLQAMALFVSTGKTPSG